MDPVPSTESSTPVSDLVWKKRATVVIEPTHRRRLWESWCGRYRVVHSRCLYGPRKGKQAIPDVWYATKLVVVSDNTCWEVISRHRQRGPAVRACEKDAKDASKGVPLCDRCGRRVATHLGIRTLFDRESKLCGGCCKHFRRYSRPAHLRVSRQDSPTRRRCPVSPDQLSFAFIQDGRD